MLCRPHVLASLVMAALLAHVSSAQAGRTLRLSETLATVPEPDVEEFVWSPDGQQLASWSRGDGPSMLHVQAADGSGVSPALVSRVGGVEATRFLPGGAGIFFVQVLSPDRWPWVVPLDGSSPATALLDRGVREVELTADGSQLVFVDDPITADRFILLSRALAGGPEIVLNSALAPQGDVHTFELSADGTRAVYWANGAAGDGLYSAPIGAAGAAVYLSVGLTNANSITLTPDSQRVVFRASIPGSSSVGLYSAAIDGSSPPVFLSASTPQLNVSPQGIYLSPDGLSAAFLANDPGPTRLYAVKVDGSGLVVPLSPPSLPGGSTPSFGSFTPDSTRVLFLLDAEVVGRTDLLIAPVDGSASASLVARAPGASSDVAWVVGVDPSGERVAFLAGSSYPPHFLYRAPVDGSAPPVLIDDHLTSSSAPLLAEFSAGGRLVYRRTLENIQELVVADLTGLDAPRRLASGEVLREFRFDATRTRIGAAGELERDTVSELFVGSIEPPGPFVRVSPDFAPAERHGGVFDIAAGARRALYLAALDKSWIHTVRSVPLLEPGPEFVLNESTLGPIDVDPAGGVEFVDGERRALFRGWRDERHGLFSAPAERRGEPFAVHAEPQPDAHVVEHVVSSDGLRVTFLADLDVDERFELFGASTVTPGPARRLSGTLVAGGDVVPGFVLTPAGGRVVYVADALVDEQFELWSSNGVDAPVRLGPVLGSSGDILTELLLTPDGSRVFFRVRTLLHETLYSAPTDGSAAAVRMPGTTGASALMRVTPDGTRVVFAGNLLMNGVNQLFSIDALGISAPVNLSATLPDYDVDQILLTPDGAHAVFHAFRSSSPVHRALFCVSVTGGTPVQVSHNLPGQDQTTAHLPSGPGFQLAPDGSRLLYVCGPNLNALGLFIRPLDLSAPAQRLTPDDGAHLVDDAFLVDPGGTWAYYVTARPYTGLHRRKLDLSSASQRVRPEFIGPMAFGGLGRVLLFLHGPAGGQHHELFGHFLDDRPFAAPAR